MYKFTKYICATYTITVVKTYFCTMIHKLMWVYFGVDWTNLGSYIILQLMQMLLAYYNKINVNCKGGAQIFWKWGPKYKIVKDIPIYILLFFFFLRTRGARIPSSSVPVETYVCYEIGYGFNPFKHVCKLTNGLGDRKVEK